MSPTVLIVNVCGQSPNPSIEYVGRRCGRWKGSILGNPFKIEEHDDRAKVCQKYHVWLCRHVQNPKSPVRKEIVRLAKKAEKEGVITLGCWCTPKQCHASSVRKAILYVLSHPEMMTAQE